MNIKFGTDNFYVRYLKRFINHELDMPTALLGKFDKNDLKQLVKYLNLPNVKSMFEVDTEIIEKFPQLSTLFTREFKNNVITYTSKNIDEETSNFLRDELDNIKDYCDSVGWYIEDALDWVDISKDINGDGKIDEIDREIIYDQDDSD